MKLEHYTKWKHDVAWESYLDNADEQARRRMTKARTGIWELRERRAGGRACRPAASSEHATACGGVSNATSRRKTWSISC